MIEHEWIEWDDFADSYLRVFITREYIDRSVPEIGPKAALDKLYTEIPFLKQKRFAHHVLGQFALARLGAIDHQFIVEFDKSILGSRRLKCDLRAAPEKVCVNSLAQISSHYVFAKLHFAQWNMGEQIVVYDQNRLTSWIKENFTTPARIITTKNLIYVTTDNLDDATLLRIRAKQFGK